MVSWPLCPCPVARAVPGAVVLAPTRAQDRRQAMCSREEEGVVVDGAGSVLDLGTVCVSVGLAQGDGLLFRRWSAERGKSRPPLWLKGPWAEGNANCCCRSFAHETLCQNQDWSADWILSGIDGDGDHIS